MPTTRMPRSHQTISKPPYENQPTYRDDNVIEGLFTRHGFERHDTEMSCGVAPDPDRVIQPWQENQGRSDPTPCTNPVVRFVLAIVALLFCAVAIVDFVARSTT